MPSKEEAHKATRHQDKIMGLFISSRRDADQLIDQAMEGDTIPLEVAILKFFQTFRVGIYGRENLRKSIADDTDARVDIGEPKVFRKLQAFFTVGSDQEEDIQTDGEKLVQEMGLIEFDLDVPPASLDKFPSAQAELRSTQIPSQPKPVLRADASPCSNKDNDKSENNKKESMKHFRDYFAGKDRPPVDVDLLIERAEEGDVAPLEEAVLEYFKQSQPAVRLRNNLRTSILHQSEGKVDLGDAASFRQLQSFYASVPKRTKFRGESEEIVEVVRDRYMLFIWDSVICVTG